MFVCLMTLRPPRPTLPDTLFPYTALFRSRHQPENERKGGAYVGRGGATDRRARCQGADKRQEKTGRKEKACCEEGSRKEGFCQEGEGELGHSRPHRPADVKPMGYDIWPSSDRKRVV